MLIFIFSYNFNKCLNFSFFCKFQGVWLQTKQDLHDSMLIAADHGRVRIENVFSDIYKGYIKVNFLVNSFLSLDAHYLFNGLFDIEHFKILSKFSSFYLCEVKKILNYEIHELSRILLHFFWFVEFVQDGQTLLVIVRFFYLLRKRAQMLCKVRVKRFFFNVFRHDGVKGISKLMRDTSIN